MRRTASTFAPGLISLLVVAATAGCSLLSGSGGDDKPAAKATPSTASRSAAPSLPPAKYTKIPSACTTLGKATIKDLVPETKDASGDAGKSSDTNARASCNWNGLDGFQYRWLEVSLQRADSVPGVGSGQAQAQASYSKLKTAATAPDGLKKGERPSVRALAGLGDESQLVSSAVEQEGNDYRDVSIVIRKDNVVVSVSYNGTGFEGSKTPSAKDLEGRATKAAKEVLTHLA